MSDVISDWVVEGDEDYVDLDSVDQEPFIRVICERCLENDEELETIGYIGRTISAREA
jgi:hypothetical protein